MNTLTERKDAFIALGKFIAQFALETPVKKRDIPYNDIFFEGMQNKMMVAEHHNAWFSNENIRFALQRWAEALQEKSLNKWLQEYNLENRKEKRVAIIMAGNIPLVGFHDFLSVLLCGHQVVVKQSSKDKQLLPYLASYLEKIEPKLKGKIHFTEERLENFDAIIATGSNNTARYFDYYFSKYPHIIRKNRNSVAVLTGKETPLQLKGLADDIFRYYGLGCRNVSKLFVPEDYNFDTFFNAVFPWNYLVNKQKYANNYDYNKAVYLMSSFPLLDNGFLLLKEDNSYSSPIATVFYEYYSSKEKLHTKIEQENASIQCVVASGFMDAEVAFGETQHPNLWDYADNEDTVSFLLKI
ncbi:MAG: acyl-CoA reductase [Flavobacteriaceae bacterium CG_4_10_14_0_8_um_filter_34_31]|nr:acyl-CoA reductase [Flavobacteriia bacterium]PIZ08313.1 MAG: acyl-CoA reductase [Flavobacteriaceae bacterium CG_4_10_14_0_8_um_filter_34_31]